MTVRHMSILSGFLVLPVLLFACSKPDKEDPDLGSKATSEEGGSEEFGAANDDAVGDGDGDAEIPANTCLTEPQPGLYGFRHHCGGMIAFGFSGAAHGHAVSRSYGLGFGPTYASGELEKLDTYSEPMIAACCGGAL